MFRNRRSNPKEIRTHEGAGDRLGNAHQQSGEAGLRPTAVRVARRPLRDSLPVSASGIPAAGPGSGEVGQRVVRGEAERVVADG